MLLEVVHIVAIIFNPHAYTGLWYSSCLSVDLSVCQLGVMATSNSHKSETSSIATKRGIGMGSVAFSDVILLKSLSMKYEAPEVMEMV